MWVRRLSENANLRLHLVLGRPAREISRIAWQSTRNALLIAVRSKKVERGLGQIRTHRHQIDFRKFDSGAASARGLTSQ